MKVKRLLRHFEGRQPEVPREAIGRCLPWGSRKNNFTFLGADASCLAVLPKRRNIPIFLRFGALPDGRINT
jgi:hypothetical protein